MSALARAAASGASATLTARDIVKAFGGTQALRGVSVDVRAEEVHAIVGENGAGKSTLVKILCGVYPSGSYSGEILLDGRAIALSSIFDAETHGIFLVPQDLQIVPRLSVAENLFLNRAPSHFGVVRPSRMLAEAARWLHEFRLEVDPATPISKLATAQQQLVVIARAMMWGVRVLALDEPTAMLTDAETQVLFDHVREFRARGIAVIYISHRLDEVTRIADRVTVLRDGLVVDRVEPGEVTASARRIVRAMVGRDVNLDRRTKARLGDEKLALECLTVAGPASHTARVDRVSLCLRGGEVLGIFGSVGCGADDLVKALLGTADGALSGEIRIAGQPVCIRSPADALALEIGYLPGDRQRDAMLPLLPIAHNISISVLNDIASGPVIRPRVELELVTRYFDRFAIKAASVDEPIGKLSGGNQQKVMLARVLSRDPQIFIFHQPTQGVDIATKEEVYRVIDTLAQDGKAVLVVSSDLEEVMVTADRILAFRRGQIAGEWLRGEVTQEAVLAAATAAL